MCRKCVYVCVFAFVILFVRLWTPLNDSVTWNCIEKILSEIRQITEPNVNNKPATRIHTRIFAIFILSVMFPILCNTQFITLHIVQLPTIMCLTKYWYKKKKDKRFAQDRMKVIFETIRHINGAITRFHEIKDYELPYNWIGKETADICSKYSVSIGENLADLLFNRTNYLKKKCS